MSNRGAKLTLNSTMNLSDVKYNRPVAGSSALEQMPHLTNKVCMLWGQGEFETFINGLIMDSRDGNRQGLPWEAAQELLFLVELSMAKRALRASEMTGIPFKEMFAQCLDNAEKIGQGGSPLALAPNPAAVDHWSDPRSHLEVGRKTERHVSATVAPVNNSRPSSKKTSWWSRLFA